MGSEYIDGVGNSLREGWYLVDAFKIPPLYFSGYQDRDGPIIRTTEGERILSYSNPEQTKRLFPISHNDLKNLLHCSLLGVLQREDLIKQSFLRKIQLEFDFSS